MTEECNKDIFSRGHSIATLDACRHRAEDWVQQIARLSGQSVDWHYSGGIANVLYLGDYDKVFEAVEKLSDSLSTSMSRLEGECGSCSGSSHRPGRIFRVFGSGAHGPYRHGDSIPDDVIAIDTH